MTPAYVRGLLIAACRKAGLDPEQVFHHLTDADLEGYAATLGSDPDFKVDYLPTAMQMVVSAVQRGTCGCPNCGKWRGCA